MAKSNQRQVRNSVAISTHQNRQTIWTKTERNLQTVLYKSSPISPVESHYFFWKDISYCWWFRNQAFTSWGKGSLSHYFQGFKKIPGGDRRISEPSTSISSICFPKAFYSSRVVSCDGSGSMPQARFVEAKFLRFERVGIGKRWHHVIVEDPTFFGRGKKSLSLLVTVLGWMYRQYVCFCCCLSSPHCLGRDVGEEIWCRCGYVLLMAFGCKHFFD